MNIRVDNIKKWSLDNCPPFAWERIMFRLLPDFKNEGLFLHLVKDNMILSEKLSSSIVHQFKELYKFEVPKEVFLTNSAN